MYNPAMGVWTIRDPEQEGLNLFENVNSNPSNLTDPLGLQAGGAGTSPTKEPATQPSVIQAGPTMLKEHETIAEVSKIAKTTAVANTGLIVDTFNLKITCDSSGKYCVRVESLKWHAQVDVLSQKGFKSQLGQWKWSDYENARGLTDAEWYNAGRFRTYWSVRTHENAHVNQIQNAAIVALTKYIEDFEKDKCFITREAAEVVMNAWQGNTNGAWQAIRNEFEKQNPVGEGFKPGQYGEAGAVRAEREFLEAEYRKENKK